MIERPAGIARRLASMLYETLLVTGVLLLTLLLPHLLIGAFAQRVASASILWAHLFLVLFVYFVGFWRHGGQTLAMKTWHIRLVSHDGQAISTAQALRRFLWCWPTLALGGIGLIWALFDRDHQFLYDRLAGTRLVSTR
jgi:uncharacterized RDD family membrane protein YckC